MIEVTWQTIITLGSVIGALSVVITLFVKIVRWVDRQKLQDEELAKLRQKHDKEVSELRSEENNHIRDIKKEQTILTYGILACLKGLKEQGCNGPVTEAIDTIEKHLNIKAHN